MMLINKSKTALVAVTVILTSCQSFGPSTTQIERAGVDIISTNSDQKLAYIKTRGNQEIFCAPREGDVADTYSSGASLGFSLPGKTENVSDSSGKGAISLGGRNPEVLLARELLFRACELASNTNANGAQTIQIYSLFLDKMIQLSKSISGTGTSSTSSIPAPINNLTTVPQMSSKSSDTNSGGANSNNTGGSSNSGNGNGKKACDPAVDWNCDPGT